MNLHRVLLASVGLNVVVLALGAYFWIFREPAPGSKNPTLTASSVEKIEPSTHSPVPFLASPAATPTVLAVNPPTPKAIGTTSTEPTNVTPNPEDEDAPTEESPIISFPGRVATAEQASGAGEAETTGLPVDSSLPGNYLEYRGVRIAVAENLGTGPGGQPTLAVDVASPPAEQPGQPTAAGGYSSQASAITQNAGSQTESSAAATDNSPGDAVTPATEDPGNPQPRKSRMQVFTPEQNLFRLKWGWAAYDMMQREAAREAANREAATAATPNP